MIKCWKKIKTTIKIYQKKIVIIGGGLSGLITGIYLLNRGADVTIVEKNNTLGGKVNYLINENYPFTIYNKSEFLSVLNEFIHF